MELNSRIIDSEGFRGTVRYTGPVAAAKDKSEIWLGIEWDKANRGKHDGSCVDEHGVLHRYFICSQGFGSFVKLNKVENGVSLKNALLQRYVSFDAPEIASENKLADSFVTTSKGKQIAIELVGEKKIRKWQQLNVIDKVSVREEKISSIGDVSAIIGHIVEIDLQDNLLYKWSEIVELKQQIQPLTSMLLHGNKFESLSHTIVESWNPDCFNGLRVLALNSCNIHSWTTVELISKFLPDIEELYLAWNKFEDIPNFEIESPTDTRKISALPNVRILDLCGCHIQSWMQVLYFSELPNLNELRLDDNPINRVHPRTDESFGNLHHLTLSGSKIEDWSDINALATYNCIYQLRLSQIPLFTGKGASEVRPKVIARMKFLQTFNASRISARERVDAERNYLRQILFDKNEGKLVDANLEHPRFEELNQLYGSEVVPMSKSTEHVNMASDMITMTFHNVSFSVGGNTDPIAKKIPASMTISRLHMMVKQLIGLEVKAQQLSLRIYKDSMPIFLDDDKSTLQYFGAIDGADIFINEK